MIRAGMLPLSKIRTDGGTQSRASLSDAVIDDYAQALDVMPPVVVFHDGKNYWLADGFHRFRAFERAREADINAEIHQGTQRDAILFSCGANARHGLRRTTEDKRRAVMALLTDAEWSEWSDHQIAYRCAVSHTMVGSMRASVTGNSSSERAYKTKHGTPAKMKTTGINADRQREPKPVRDRPHQQVTTPLLRIEPSDLGANAALDAAEEAVERRRAFLASWEKLTPTDREWAFHIVSHWKNSLPAHDGETGEIIEEHAAESTASPHSGEGVQPSPPINSATPLADTASGAPEPAVPLAPEANLSTSEPGPTQARDGRLTKQEMGDPSGSGGAASAAIGYSGKSSNPVAPIPETGSSSALVSSEELWDALEMPSFLKRTA